MKTSLFKLATVTLFSALLIASCKKEPVADPNQPLLDQMKAVTDSMERFYSMWR